LYGERFRQSSLRHFGYYDAPGENETRIVENKSLFLRSLVEVTQNRAGAYDYLRPYGLSDNVSGLHWRLSVLLGFRLMCGRFTTEPFRERNLLLAPEDQEVAPGTTTLPGDSVDRHFRTLSVKERMEKLEADELKRAIEGLSTGSDELLSGEVLRHGIEWDRYRIGREYAGQDYRVAYHDPDDGRWWELGRFSSEAEAVRSVQALRAFLLELNTDTEGFHLVEHILLRPQGGPGSAHEGIIFSEGEEFYSLRLSLVFPAWTARCHDPEFRSLVEETVRINCPAHIVPECHWLEFGSMYEFEGLFSKWAELMRQDSNSGEIDVAAAALVRFLLSHRVPR
jgi:hypothetical protein